LCVLLATVAFTDAIGRVLTRRGRSLDQRTQDNTPCAAGVTGFGGRGEGSCFDPSSPPPGGCNIGALTPSTSCPDGQKCCLYVQCAWTIPASDPLYAENSPKMFGTCAPQSTCSTMPKRRAITPSDDCSGANMVCCISLPGAGTVGSAMDDDDQRVKLMSSWKCNGGSCDPQCATGTLQDDPTGVCGGGKCCVTDSSPGTHDSADDASANTDASAPSSAPSSAPDSHDSGDGDHAAASTDGDAAAAPSAAPSSEPSSAPSADGDHNSL